jgi:hypothetical protein
VVAHAQDTVALASPHATPGATPLSLPSVDLGRLGQWFVAALTLSQGLVRLLRSPLGRDWWARRAQQTRTAIVQGAAAVLAVGPLLAGLGNIAEAAAVWLAVGPLAKAVHDLAPARRRKNATKPPAPSAAGGTSP